MSQCLAKVASVANLLNQLVRGGVGLRMDNIARKLTMGRLLIVGDKGCPPKKYHRPKGCLFLVTNRYSAENEEKQEMSTFKDNAAREQHAKSKLEPYEEYAQSHAQLHEEIFTRVRSPPPRAKYQNPQKPPLLKERLNMPQ